MNILIPCICCTSAFSAAFTIWCCFTIDKFLNSFAEMWTSNIAPHPPGDVIECFFIVRYYTSMIVLPEISSTFTDDCGNFSNRISRILLSLSWSEAATFENFKFCTCRPETTSWLKRYEKWNYENSIAQFMIYWMTYRFYKAVNNLTKHTHSYQYNFVVVTLI